MTHWLALINCVPDWRTKKQTRSNCYKIYATNSNKLQSQLINSMTIYLSILTLAWIHKLIMQICCIRKNIAASILFPQKNGIKSQLPPLSISPREMRAAIKKWSTWLFSNLIIS